mmetsp:Transcript_112133/g.194692  ORF Transcript_112133/g.194692 Transcript_112133/m.194692 type:complete len:329 (-) Transcript_112133:1408-2394(-)
MEVGTKGGGRKGRKERKTSVCREHLLTAGATRRGKPEPGTTSRPGGCLALTAGLHLLLGVFTGCVCKLRGLGLGNLFCHQNRNFRAGKETRPLRGKHELQSLRHELQRAQARQDGRFRQSTHNTVSVGMTTVGVKLTTPTRLVTTPTSHHQVEHCRWLGSWCQCWRQWQRGPGWLVRGRRNHSRPCRPEWSSPSCHPCRRRRTCIAAPRCCGRSPGWSSAHRRASHMSPCPCRRPACCRPVRRTAAHRRSRGDLHRRNHETCTVQCTGLALGRPTGRLVLLTPPAWMTPPAWTNLLVWTTPPVPPVPLTPFVLLRGPTFGHLGLGSTV